MTNLKSFLLGLSFLINIVLYPIWMIGHILGMISDPPRTRNYAVDYFVMGWIICILTIGLAVWTIAMLFFMNYLIG